MSDERELNRLKRSIIAAETKMKILQDESKAIMAQFKELGVDGIEEAEKILEKLKGKNDAAYKKQARLLKQAQDIIRRYE